MSLRMFVWTDVLTDYTSGLVCALAETTEQAEQLAADEYAGPLSEYQRMRAHQAKMGLNSSLVSMTDEQLAAHREVQRQHFIENELRKSTLTIYETPKAVYTSGGS